MAENKPKQDDLSIEEILGSIRRIIAEDEDDTANTAAAPQAATAQDAGDSYEDEDEAPLELTNKIESDGTIVHTPVDDISIDLSSTNDDIGLSEPVISQPTIIAEAAPAPPQQDISPAQEPVAMTSQNETLSYTEQSNASDALLSATTASATAAVMAKLARQAAINEAGNGGITIEGVVREMLRPMLREWLDQNLPELVQAMVERELERLTKRL